ncbi:MAG: PLP-dependent aminotransferase family protein [Lachnospiraceae bacterium]|nr:PLP-dependent aminotransferase family protein [Lachnospiraceae bacterium]
MNNIISERIKNTPPSFIRGILKAAERDDVISFAGGLPNPISFPQEALQESMNRVIAEHGSHVFQYAATAGLLSLREYIADKYKRQYKLEIEPDDIIITTGSQQALDLIGKVLINEGDAVLVEEPGYLGAIQAFSQYQPKFYGVPLLKDGPDICYFEEILKKEKVKFAYLIPNFQNPTGLTYSAEKRAAVLELARKYHCILVEDDPYGELSFNGKVNGYISRDGLEESILLGTFSKIVTPGMRLGFMIIKDEKLRKYVNTAKEAADLHSNIFAQYCIWDYVMHNDIQEHIKKIRKLYKEQCETMIQAMERYFPKEISFTKPEGGMFIWATLPEGQRATALFEKALSQKVAFVPGNPFYTDGREANTMRLNYTNASKEMIEEGIKRLAKLFDEITM